MTADMGYFELVWRTDPTYGAEDAVREYLFDHPEVARDIIYQMDRDDMPFDYDALEDYLKSMGAVDAFNVGMMSADKCSLADDYFRFDAYGHVESMSDWEFNDWCMEVARDNAFDIAMGKYEIPQELAKIIQIWDVCPEDLGLSYFDNRKPKAQAKTSTKKAPAKKTVKKAPAKKATVKKKSCSTKKVVSKNVKAKAPPKKPTPAVKKKTARRAA